MAIGRTIKGGNPNLFIYNEGNEFTSITGGFAEVKNTVAGVTVEFNKNAGNLEIINTHTTTTNSQRSYFQTANPIDLTDYRAVLIDVERAGSADTFSVYLGLDVNSGDTIFDEQYLLSASTAPTFNVVDISAITGSYYIYLGMTTNDDDNDVATVRYYKVYLVK